ncbi:hypothetical protein Btru_020788 [Bulinus truncatus]|nr:hypothetical protein Btru_020788 [Bulinus truncatus]
MQQNVCYDLLSALKTPPAFAEKTKQLERAKTGDLLRHKIQHRPDRQALVQQHILEDTTIDPSLHERQRLLKRSRLLDGLNDKLAHRPGPLELVQGNILQPSHELANAIKDGTIQFVPTCDTEDMDQSGSSFLFDEESTGSDGAPSPQMDESSGLSDVSSPSSTTPVASSEPFPISFTFSKSISIPVTISKGQQIPLVSSTSSLAAVTLPKQQVAVPGALVNISSHSSTGKPRSKKLKPKTTSKARIIKFHEYKGPPSVVKSQSSSSSASSSSTNNSTEDTPYHIMLQQQQLFLQWQLEFQQKQHQQSSTNSPIMSTASVGDTSPSSSNVTNMIVTSPVISTTSTSPSFIQQQPVNNSNLVSAVSLQQTQNQSPNAALLSQQPSPAQLLGHISSSPPAPPPPPPLPPSRPTQSVAPRTATKALTSIPANALSLPKLTGNLEEMKVADLKAELKKRSLPVSGPKPQLIERLKPFTESTSSIGVPPPSSSLVAPKSSTQHPSSNVSTPLHFSQTTFQIKQEPNGDASSSTARPIPSSTETPVLMTPSSAVQSSSLPITLPITTLGLKTVVSVKPMIKEEPMATTDVSPPNSPHGFLNSVQGPRTPMTPEYDSTSPPPLSSKVPPTAPPPLSQSLLKSSGGHLVLNTCHTLMAPGQTVVSMSTDHTQPSSVVPAEMMPMEVDSVSVDLNQGVDDTAFKAASLGHSLDSVSFKALIQPVSNNNFKTISLSQSSLESNPIKINTNLLDASNIKTVNLSPNFDGSSPLRSVSLSPNTEPATIKTVNLGSCGDNMSTIKSLSLSPSADMTGFKTMAVSPSTDNNSLIKTLKVPLSQLSPNHISPVQLTAPLTQTLTSPASLLQLQQLQQLQTLQQLQQQLLQQTQAQQQALQQSSTVSLTANDHVVLAQAKQIEELQRQLQESHFKLKLQQLQQQQMQLQQQQQQMWQVRIPSNFTQNSLLAKLSQDQLTTQQISQVLTTPVQLQQSLTTQQPLATVVHQQQPQLQQQHQPTSVFLNGHSLQQAPLVMSGVHQSQQQKQQTQAAVAVSSSSIVSAGTSSINFNNLATVAGENGSLNIVTSASGQPAVSLPYAIHINLSSSGQMKLPPQLQPITTSATSPTTVTKSSALSSLQLPAHLLLSAQSQSLLHNSANIKTEPGVAQAMGPPATTSVPKSHANNSQVFVTSSGSTAMVTGHGNGLITRTASLPTTPMVSEQTQKMATIQRCTSNPFFNGHFKEPPRYDEAIKIKQQQTAPPLNSTKTVLGTGNTVNDNGNINVTKPLSIVQAETDLKSQTMDDVLEILIRNGDLPPSAATEPLPTPKTAPGMTLSQPVMSSSSSSLACMSVTQSLSPVSQNLLTQQCHSPFPSVPSNHQLSNPSSFGSANSPRDQTLTSVHTNMLADSFLNDTCTSSPVNTDMGHMSSHSDGGELLDWGEMLPSPDLSNMDWSSEHGFNHLDLCDSNLNLETKAGDNVQSNSDQNNGMLVMDHFSPSYKSDSMDTRYNFLLGMDHLSPPYKANSHLENDNMIINSSGLYTPPSGQGSEPDLTVLGLGGDSSDAVDPSSQMDMSDWLDVIMPNASLPVSHTIHPTPHVSFTADPILTPRSQQEVFDIFNFDDSDFGPSAIGIN